jgi:hypothetical protein
MRVPWTRREVRWRDALLQAAVPPGAVHPGLGAVELDAFWREYQQAAPLVLRLGFRASVWALTLAPVAMGEGRPLHHLPPERQDAALERLSASENALVRQLVLATKLVAAFAYFTDDDVRARWARP